jgi:hypothetical protein
MGEANLKREAAGQDGLMVGYLTRREQVVLGLVLNGQRQDKREGNRQERRRKREVFARLGLTWVSQRITERGNDPAYQGKPFFSNDEMTLDQVEFKSSVEDLAWVLEQLDKVPAAGADDLTLADIEDHLADVKNGNFTPPRKLRSTEAT